MLHRLGQKGQHDPRRDRNGQPTRYFAAQLRKLRIGPFDLADDQPRMLQKYPAGLGEVDPSSGSHYQR
ncbi:hypothetical protein D9M72_646000 [compost metagenome]